MSVEDDLRTEIQVLREQNAKLNKTLEVLGEAISTLSDGLRDVLDRLKELEDA